MGARRTGLLARGTAIALLAIVGTTPASAAPPSYFHRAGVDRETFVADYGACDALASGVRAPRYAVYSANIYAAAAGSFFAGFFGSRERRGMVDNVLRTCMADKGYRRIEATPETRKELNRLDEKARVDRLFQLASAASPTGKMLPR